ncbi:hypothetical protein SCHPADRAFT_373498 [Schizopora paradoxa]|uniref:Ricin B lectin domain-containing protein n=1 Tax=Schizopora paradoxa TaxID=27342 RepID=A0A0H2S8S6_9AGAM|nr:hypothetical protein SCHPADRAFT_373498 [Schizopora paradoxa]
MTSVTGAIQSGTYKIKCVASGNYANLNDDNTDTSLTGTKEGDAAKTTTIKWNVVLSNGKYTIKNNTFPSKQAFGSTQPSEGQVVVSRKDAFEWNIKETNNNGQYLISPTVDNTLFWNLESGTETTPIKLQKESGTKSQWNFILA